MLMCVQAINLNRRKFYKLNVRNVSICCRLVEWLLNVWKVCTMASGAQWSNIIKEIDNFGLIDVFNFLNLDLICFSKTYYLHIDIIAFLTSY